MKFPVKTTVVILIVAVVALAVSRLPGGFSTDLARVGGGTVTVVMVHDHNFVSSVELMEALNRVRDDFEPEMQFLVADVNHPNGAAFKRERNLEVVSLYVFDPQGERVGERLVHDDLESLRAFLENHRP